jgi:transcriptional regulator with XRE-family HTH domain
MNEKERIKQIMSEENMTPAKFSERIGIQRGAMSHILKERNNPSLDVIKKILKAFSDINPDWLLYGEGPMRRNAQNRTNVPNKDLFSSSDFQQPTVPLKTRSATTGGNPVVADRNTNRTTSTQNSPNTADIRTEIHYADEKTPGEENNYAENQVKDVVKETIIYKERPNKTIEKLLIFYSDNTFETFIPEKHDQHDNK